MFIKEGVQLGGVANTGGFYNESQSFIRIGDGKKHRPQENKAARISEGELLDMLAGLFKEYKFWPLKRLKERTRQPEAFLREQLNKIAVLVKTGNAANTWTLNANVAATLNMRDEDLADYNPDEPDIKEEEIAPPASGADNDSVDDDDDEDMEMEDVV
jgi:transcription initiation factor TFIIF subunit beta